MSLRNIGIVYRKRTPRSPSRSPHRDCERRHTALLVSSVERGLFTFIGSIVNKTGEASPKVMVIGGDDSQGCWRL